MFKPLTLSVSLTLALAVTGISQAGHKDGRSDGCTTCGLASPQGVYPTSQSVIASPQSEGCGDVVESGHKCHLRKKLSGMFAHKPKSYTYEWVLKKKKVHGHKASGCGGAAAGCDTCASPVETVYASGQNGAQYASPQYAAPQYGSAQHGSPQYSSAQYGSGQAGNGQYGSGQYGSGQYGSGQYGTGQAGSGQYAPAGQMAPAPAMPPTGDVPPPPEVAPAPAAPSASVGSPLFLSPAGN